MTPLYIPTHLWNTRSLTLLERILLAEVARQNTLRVADEAIAEALGVKVEHIARTLARLTEMRFVVVKQAEDGCREVWLTELATDFWRPVSHAADDPEKYRNNSDGDYLLSIARDVLSTIKSADGHLPNDQREAGRQRHSGGLPSNANDDQLPVTTTLHMFEDMEAVAPTGDDDGPPGSKACHLGPEAGLTRQATRCEQQHQSPVYGSRTEWAQGAHARRDKDPPPALKTARTNKQSIAAGVVQQLQGGYTLPAPLFDLLPPEVILATHRGEPCIPLNANKKPVVLWKPFQNRMPRPEEFKSWACRLADKTAGWARVTGRISNLIVLDDDGGGWLERWGLSPHVRTKRGGCHWIGEYPGWRVPTLNCKTSKTLAEAYPGLDIRGDGGYSIICGFGDGYEWLREAIADPLDLLPQHARRFFGLEAPPKPQRRLESQSISLPMGGDRVEADYLVRRAIVVARSRGRNTGAMWLAAQLRDNGYTEGEAEATGRAYLRDVPDVDAHGKIDPYTEEELLAAIRWNFQQQRREPWRKQ